VFIVGCATQPKDLPTTYVSHLAYQNYSCNQIAVEVNRVNRRVGELRSDLKQTADDDAGQMAIGMILFWPALFFLEGGDGPEAAEFSRLKGEYVALERAAIEKDGSMATNASETDLLEAAELVSDCGQAKQVLIDATTRETAELAAVKVKALCNDD